MRRGASFCPDSGAAGSDVRDLSVDEIGRGELVLAQPRSGYRLSVDALILARFAEACAARTPDVVVDLGCGCGVIGLALAQRWPSCRAVLVELQPQLAQLARQNVRRNNCAERVTVQCGDLRRTQLWRQRGRRVFAVTNPPFFRLRHGRVSPDPMIAVAKHEVSCTLEQMVEAWAQGLSPGDRLAIIYAADRRDELIRRLTSGGFRPRRLRSVVPLPGRDARRVLVCAERVDLQAACEIFPGPQEDPPLVVHESLGVYSAQMREMLGD